MTALAKIDEYVAQFEREFSPYVGCTDRAYITSIDVEDQREYSLLVGYSLSVTTTPSTWYINSGVSIHMRGTRDMLSHFIRICLEGAHDVEGCLVYP